MNDDKVEIPYMVWESFKKLESSYYSLRWEYVETREQGYVDSSGFVSDVILLRNKDTGRVYMFKCNRFSSDSLTASVYGEPAARRKIEQSILNHIMSKIDEELSDAEINSLLKDSDIESSNDNIELFRSEYNHVVKKVASLRRGKK